MEITVEEYQESDLPAMLKVWNDVVMDGLAFPQEDVESLESGKVFFAGQSYCGVARDIQSGRIFGLYILHPNNVGRCGHICNCSYAVAREARNLGIGKKLVADSISRGKKLGFRIMQFNAVTVDNLAANALYPELGFQLLGRVPEGFRRPSGNYVDINLYFRQL